MHKIFITTGRCGGKSIFQERLRELCERHDGYNIDTVVLDEDFDATNYWDKKEINTMIRNRSHYAELFAPGVDRRDIMSKSYVCVNGKKYRANNLQVDDHGPREALEINVSAIFEPENEIRYANIPVIMHHTGISKVPNKVPPLFGFPEIKNVIFNYPATIVFWNDGTKTIVKCKKGDQWDPHAGISAAIAKKFFGTEVNKWVKKAEYAKKPPVEGGDE